MIDADMGFDETLMLEPKILAIGGSNDRDLRQEVRSLVKIDGNRWVIIVMALLKPSQPTRIPEQDGNRVMDIGWFARGRLVLLSPFSSVLHKEPTSRLCQRYGGRKGGKGGS
jgi:hypothetical protein